MKKKLIGITATTAVLATPAMAQATDPGALVVGAVGGIAGYAAAVIPAGLLVWAAKIGVRKAKGFFSASS